MKASQKSKILQKEILTTKDAAELIGVSLPSIINWADAGRFESFRTPGGHRRIRTKDFIIFASENGYLLDGEVVEVSEGDAILLVDTNIDYMETLKEFLAMDGKLRVLTCSTIFEAGLLVGMFSPNVLVFDQETISMPGDLISILQGNSLSKIHIVSLATEFPVPVERQSDNYIYLKKGKAIREITTSLQNLVSSSVIVL